MVWGTRSRQDRGYDAAWERVRKVVIDRDQGLCQKCLADGRVTMGKDVDHKKSKAACAKLGWSRAQMDHPSNLWYLCRLCHLEKSREEVGATYKPKVKYGPDGWPIK